MINRDDHHALYKEISRELNSLSSDLAKGLGALRYATETNRSSAEDLKRDLRERSERLRDMVSTLQQTEAASQVRLASLERALRDQEAKIDTLVKKEARGSVVMEGHTETRKGQWAVYAAIAAGILSIISQVVVAMSNAGMH
ncbi:MAG: hypothetical protein DRH30_02530 [Deltaproteobacteria bacterium]|nr:MAG: hypothetical protein DRH30_02530 [Deltaproteobacteria bacterium]